MAQGSYKPCPGCRQMIPTSQRLCQNCLMQNASPLRGRKETPPGQRPTSTFSDIMRGVSFGFGACVVMPLLLLMTIVCAFGDVAGFLEWLRRVLGGGG